MEHEFFFRGLERQRLIYSILQAPPSEHGAGIDLASLLAGGRWRLASSDASDASDDALTKLQLDALAQLQQLRPGDARARPRVRLLRRRSSPILPEPVRV